MFMKNLWITLSIIAAHGCASTKGDDGKKHDLQQKPYLRYSGDELVSTHGLNIALKIPKSYSAEPIISYEATYNDHPFYVSFAPFLAKGKVIAMHAESVTDNSGYLNYSHLDEFKIDGILLYRKDQCLQLDDKTIDSMADLRYLDQLGFDLKSPIYSAQMFKHSDDGNREIVLTIAKNIVNCESLDGLKEELTEEIRNIIDIRSANI